MPRHFRRIFAAAAIIAGGAAAAWALWPAPVAVELAYVGRGSIRVTVDEDGRTRIRERYVVSAPLAGRLVRVRLKEGDEVVANETVVAAIDPADPGLLDPRARAEATARVNAADAGVLHAEAALTRAAAALELAQSELRSLREAGEGGAATALELERLAAAASMRRQDVRAAEFAREIARFELELARAALLRSGPDSESWRFEIRAPASGRVLRVFQESAAVINPGAPLVEIGDPSDLELVVDVLSNDGVAIRAGAPVLLEHWGGGETLHGRVRLVEPAAFTKFSALGVEEQRVNVIIDFLDPPERRAGLGDGFRVEARIVVWEGDDVLRVPTGALFRHSQSWSVFVVDSGRVRVRDVQLGRRNPDLAQVLSGLNEGEAVVVYPSDRVREGARVRVR